MCIRESYLSFHIYKLNLGSKHKTQHAKALEEFGPMNMNDLAGDINITFSYVTDRTWSYSVKEDLSHFPQKARTSTSQVMKVTSKQT